jgi:hypothetical protein
MTAASTTCSRSLATSTRIRSPGRYFDALGEACLLAGSLADYGRLATLRAAKNGEAAALAAAPAAEPEKERDT